MPVGGGDTGGVPAPSGGEPVAGAVNQGGEPASGGEPAAGGTPAEGGAPEMGGAPGGGGPEVGGEPGSGGEPEMGGEPGSGGEPEAGGEPAPVGGEVKCVMGSATPQKSRPTPMPAAKSMASQESVWNSGRSSSRPSRTRL